MKTCTKCGLTKDFSCFRRRGEIGYKPDCKDCARLYNLANREKQLAQMKVYREANKEKILPFKQAWKERNREQVREANRTYQKAAKSLINARTAKRRALKKNATPAWADAGKMKEFYFAADFLGMVTGEWYHVDHIVPLQSKLVRGLHCEENFQVLPGIENWKKGNTQWPDMP
jgi:hypothetical protein